MLQPVSSRLPSSQNAWDETNLPMCIVVTPLDEKDTATTTTTTTTAAAATASSTTTMSLGSFPKCLSCGAPHPTSHTHFALKHSNELVCYLCAQISSTLLEDQQAIREDKLNEDYRPFPLGSSDAEVDEEEQDDDDDDDDDAQDQVPSKSVSAITLPLKGHDSMPAMACPPVWWIVLDATAADNKDYWDNFSRSFQAILPTLPSHLHVAWVLAGESTLTLWDLPATTSTSSSNTTTKGNNTKVERFHLLSTSLTQPFSADLAHSCLRPLDQWKSHVPNLLQAMQDHVAAQTAKQGTADTDAEADADMDLPTGVSLSLVMTLLLEWMEPALPASAIAALPEEPTQDDDTGAAANEAAPPLIYAGGRILTVLANPPVELQLTETPAAPKPDPKLPVDPTDMTPMVMKNQWTSPDPKLWYELGAQAAHQALGLDILVATPSEDVDVDDTPSFGLPLLRFMAQASGAPAPVLLSPSDDWTDELQARVPSVLDVQIRLRISPGFHIEDAPVGPTGGRRYKDALQLAPFLPSQGLCGPGVAQETGLWSMATCDPHTSIVIDLEADKKVPKTWKVPQLGEVPSRPMLQVCTAYTTFVKDPKTKQTNVVRKMNIVSQSMPLAEQTEDILESLDPEALALVVFHKLQLSALQDGFHGAQNTAQQWLKSVLTSVYQSAVKQNKDTTGATHSPLFVASERLVQIPGDLEDEEVILGKGHEKTAGLASIIYALMQCDAFRPCDEFYQISLDERAATLARLSSMTPSTLVKYLAPAIQLWSHKDDECVFEAMDWASEAVQLGLDELKDDAVFFVDSPDVTLVHKKHTAKSKLSFGPNLMAAVKQAQQSYRVPPTSVIGEDKDKSAETVLEPFLFEDRPSAGESENFIAWSTELADQIRTLLQKSRDIPRK